ncbi:MAG: ATP-binding cassette domain-containing protein [Verrucomicrobiota bacterium]
MKLLSVKNLKVYFPVRTGLFQKKEYIKAVDDVSFDIEKGQCVGLVGESGSGKSTLGKSIIRLNSITSGSIQYAKEELADKNNRAFMPFRKRIQMIFQDPYNSLNPRMNVEAIIGEPLDIHFPELKVSGKKKRTQRICELLEMVGLQADHTRRYPHEFSGGQRQRIGIARALAVEPEFIICDEPVSALDVSVQAQIINLLDDLKDQLGLTYLFISHDLAVVEHLCDHVLVMNQGKLVETGEPASLYQSPKDPYTKKLLDAVPNF